MHSRRRSGRRPCDVPWWPHDLTHARPYPCGWRCDRHSPWALAGRQPPGPGPGWPIHRQPLPDPAPQGAAPTGAIAEQDDPS